jgi:hypothetical protein
MSEITARIYWDNQDAANTGWAWATRVDGEHDDTGPLDDCDDDATDADLRDALRAQVNSSITDDAVEIVR